MFALSVNPQRGLVEIKLMGLMSLDEVRDLHLELVAELDHHSLEPGAFDLLLDTSQFAIQPQEIHNALLAFSRDRRTCAARAALVTGASAQRMQARRAQVSYPREFFRDRPAALAWLRNPDLPVRCAA
jgi:hypothetical protein